MAEVRTNLRLPEELYAQIKRIAEREDRSINAQMVRMLREAAAQAQDRQERKEEHTKGTMG